jgi:hypothetical protein
VVVGIVRSVVQPAPYLIYGPPGETVENAIVVPTTGSRVFMTGRRVLLAGSRFPTMDNRFGTGNLAGSVVKVFMWAWIDVALIHYLRRESTAYAGMLLD